MVLFPTEIFGFVYSLSNVFFFKSEKKVTCSKYLISKIVLIIKNTAQTSPPKIRLKFLKTFPLKHPKLCKWGKKKRNRPIFLESIFTLLRFIFCSEATEVVNVSRMILSHVMLQVDGPEDLVLRDPSCCFYPLTFWRISNQTL